MSTYNLPMLWLDPHLYEKGSFYAHTLPVNEGVFSGAEGVLFLVRIPSAFVMPAELATSSLEGLDIFYLHITWNRIVDLVRIYMNINAYMSIDATKPVFRVSDKIIPKPAFSATETR